MTSQYRELVRRHRLERQNRQSAKQSQGPLALALQLFIPCKLILTTSQKRWSQRARKGGQAADRQGSVSDALKEGGSTCTGCTRLGTLKVIAHKKALEELSDGVRVGVGFLLNDADKVLQHVAPPFVDNHRRRQVPQQVVRVCLDRVHVPAGSAQASKRTCRRRTDKRREKRSPSSFCAAHPLLVLEKHVEDRVASAYSPP
eukprot:907573-Pyramimonas_sp.AAC.1